MAEAIPANSPLAPTRVVVRATSEFVLRSAADGIRTYGSLGRMVVLTAIGLANAQPIAQSAVLTWRYAHVDQIPPDEARQPVSVKSLADSLNIPLGTARDHVMELIDLGLCVRELGGVIIPAHVLGSPRITAFQQNRWESFRLMIDQLKAINFDFAAVLARSDLESELVLEPGFQAPMSKDPPRRLISRVTAAYFLSNMIRGSEPFCGDWMKMTIFAAIMFTNSEEMGRDPRSAWLYSRADTPPPDDLRQPASVAKIAARLSIDEQTASRHIEALIADGKLDEVKDGVLASMTFMQSSSGVSASVKVTRAFYRMIYDLANLGVRF